MDAAASAVEDLEVFQRAYRISLAVHRSSLDFPAVEQRALADQIRRASKSICANLAEGFARQGLAPADFRRFVVMAMGSALAELAPGVSRDRQDAAGPAQGGAASGLISDLCSLSSELVAERSVGR